MKYLAIFILLFVCLYCEANADLVCQVYDEKTKTLEKYCDGSFKGTLPYNCSTAAAAASGQPSIVASFVEKLKLIGCGSAEVLKTTKLYRNIRVLDISQSGYQHLEWMSLMTQLNNLKLFNASHNEIENLTDLLHSALHVNEIDLSFNKIRTISMDAFGTLNKLISIDLSNNNIQHINSNGFSKICTNLQHIDLSQNWLVGIPELPACKKLQILHLEENTIKNFTCQRIPWRDTLSAVYLSWTYVERFDGNEHCDGKQFRVIWDGDNEGILRTTNGSIITYELHCNQQSFRNLRSFSAGRSAFGNITYLMRSFDSQLRELDVSNNVIGMWDQAELKTFVNLRKLVLSGTRLAHFNMEMIEGARYLESLDISDNPTMDGGVQSISTLKTFRHLKEFNLSNCRFQHDTTVKILNYLTPSIESLDLSDSHVKLYAGTFERFAQHDHFNSTLKVLNLRNTNLALADERNPFEKLTQLHSLDISENANLSDVDFRTLSATLIKLHHFEVTNCGLKDPLNKIVPYLGVSMKKLNLAGNPIPDGGADKMHCSVFQTLTNLIHLNLSAIGLHEFDLKTIMKQEFLYTLDLSENHLQTINLHALPHFIHLKRLYLNDNELTQIDNFKPNESPDVSLALAQNRLPCLYLKDLKQESPHLRYIGNQLDQKHGDDCRSSVQAIGDFLGTVYDTVKFW